MEAGIFHPTVTAQAESRFIEDIWPGIFNDEVVLSHLSYHPGAVRFDELVLIASIVRHLNPKRIFEIGTGTGRTSINMFNNAPNLDALYTLNLPPDECPPDIQWLEQDKKLYEQSRDEIGICFKNIRQNDTIYQVYGDSKAFDFKECSNIDFIFIDGSKRYDYVYSDSDNALDIISEGGVIIWHDYGYADEVTQAVDTFASDEGIEIFHIHKTTLGVYRG